MSGKIPADRFTSHWDESIKIPYIDYHVQSSRMRDIDPANDCLVYIANRFELSIEQRYWLAFLYSTCYCGPTVFYIYQEFPDFENVDIGRLQRWWKSNKQKCVFQTDRLRIKSNDQFVPTFESYRNLIGRKSQQEFFYKMRAPTDAFRYDVAYKTMGQVRNIGRFTLFIYLEMVNLLTDFNCLPSSIDWQYADNCREGLQHAFGDSPGKGNLNYYRYLDAHLKNIQTQINKKVKANIFNIETTLCAYTKYLKGQRYIGYYIDRQKQEIEKMKANVTEGVCWRVLDEFRKETYKPHPNLKEPI